jgi:hypothetical protein
MLVNNIDRISKPNVRVEGIFILLPLLLLTYYPLFAESNPVGSTQSFISLSGGTPYISSSYEGYFRPYYYEEEQLKPYIRFTDPLLEDLDLFSPFTLSADNLLMAGNLKGKANHDLFLIDRAKETVLNLTSSPKTDDGNHCVSNSKNLFSFRSGSQQRIRQSIDPLTDYHLLKGVGFRSCVFISEKELWGLKKLKEASSLYFCNIGKKMNCRKTNILKDIEKVTSLSEVNSEIYFTGRKKSSLWYRVFQINQTTKNSANEVPGQDQDVDYLSYNSGNFRIGRHSHYWLSNRMGKDEIIYNFKSGNGKTYVVAANTSKGKTLASLVHGKIRFFYPGGQEISATQSDVNEIWIESGSTRYQGFLWGQAESKKPLILWLHGGPHENVSPRFNPYFEKLQKLGFDVFALNYPGSTGRGRRYEDSFQESEVRKSLDAFFEDSHFRGREVVVWSISAGYHILQLMLKQNYPVKAYIEQVGFEHLRTRSLAKKYKKELFIIQGQHDRAASKLGVDYLYDGGHDIRRAANFLELFTRLEPFLKNGSATARAHSSR